MDATEAARQEAERIHQAAVATGDDPWNLLVLVKQEAMRRGLDVYGLAPGDPALMNGRAVLDRVAGCIMHENFGPAFDQAFLIAHELGHYVLEPDVAEFVTHNVQPERSVSDAPVGAEQAVDYGAKERREVRMDLFARELLMPRSFLRQHHIESNLSSAALAERLGAPLPVVQMQLLDALLLPEVAPTAPAGAAQRLSPDPTQREAAAHRGSPLLLQAGPGTGKTRTLVQRIEGLLAEGVDPTTILVLTFSNKAAHELSERLAARHPLAAAAMWIGTFHAFGLDIVRRFHDKLDLPSEPRLIDRAEGVELLEDELPRLALRHYRNLWDATLDLSDMLSAVSRAKDEVVDATGYRALANAMLKSCGSDDDARERAEKCLEVALVFEAYEQLMRKRQAIDFGDLVALPVRLVESDTTVRHALRVRHQHLLVDEYQDVNRASVRLLKAIAGDGRNLWVVGDARQSIYRFRGASAANMVQFGTDFPGATVSQLGVNYRSGQEIIDTFSVFSSTMKASEGSLPLRLTASRGVLRQPSVLTVAGTAADEVEAVATAIQDLQARGTAFRDQAVLCASNARLNEIAEGLQARGIPVLHLGSLFERSEVKNLLAMLSLLGDPYAMGLARMTTMPSFSIPLQDVMNLVATLRERGVAALDWRQSKHWPADLAETSRSALARAAALFEGVNPMGKPWQILASWVIDRLGQAKLLYQAGDAKSRTQAMALWQFLNFCREQPGGAGAPCTRLLERIRRLVLLSEDRGLRQLPSPAEGIDAVRLMTIHGSKGLEFHSVHIPGLVATGLPRSNRPPRCLPPDGLIHGSAALTGMDAVRAGHDEEEECIFFVALSRARDRLLLYASSVRAGGGVRNLSKFIAPIRHSLAQPKFLPQAASAGHTVPGLTMQWEQRPSWTDHQLSLFERCPRRFLYTHVMRLGGRRAETAFMKMHNVVADVNDWLKNAHALTIPEEAELNNRFDEAWHAKGPVDHGYADDYRRIARKMVSVVTQQRSRGAPIPVAPVSLAGGAGEIVVVPDAAVRDATGQIVVQRIKTGKPRSNGFDDIEYAALQLAVVQAHGGAAQVEITYLTSETTQRMEITPRKLQTRRERLLEIVRLVHAGHFPPQEDARACPRCPSFFICGALPAGALAVKKV